MSTRHTAETFEQRGIGTLLNGGSILASVFLGGFLGFFGLIFAGPVGGLVVAVAVALAVLGLLVYSNAATSVTVTDDELVETTNTPWGSENSFPLDSVDVVIRKPTTADSVFGTGTYEVVLTGGHSETVWFLADPEGFERVMAERVAPPREQYRGASTSRNHFWHLWPSTHEDDIPEEPVVDESELESTLDADLSDIDLGGLDDAVTMESIEDFGDVETAVEGPGDAGGFDDAGGGGGFDGGGADGGGGGE